MRALIVDDEFEIREGLRKRIPWEDYGVAEVLAADDGDTALALARDARPELIVTDIKMSRMSGLDFLGELQSIPEYIWKAVLISGYDDFDLVKHGMQLGAVDYILKPINTDELGRTVLRAKEQVLQEMMDRQNERQLRSQMQLAIPKLREELLREIAEHDYDPYRETRLTHRLRVLKLDWMLDAPLVLMLTEADDLKAIPPGERQLVLFGIGNVVNQTLEEECPLPYALFSDSHGRWAAVFACREPDDAARVQALGQECLQRINRFVKVKASIGLSRNAQGWRRLHALFAESSELLCRKLVYGGNRLFTEVTDGGPDADRCEMSIAEPGEVLDLVRYGSDEDIRACVGRFDELVQSWTIVHPRDLQQHIFQWLMGVFRRAAAAGWPDRSWERDPIAVWEHLELYDNLASLKEQIERHLLAIAADFRRQSVSPSLIVQEAEKLIRHRYADNLSLQAVAEEVHVTPVWLSKLFKRETGKTFLECLTEVRMAKAKEMLADVRYKIYQVSNEVGYKDPVYFSKLFKKLTGCTPKEYRRQRGVADG